MDTWIHFGLFIVALAGAAGAVVHRIGTMITEKFTRMDLQFAKIDLKIDGVEQQFREQFDKLRDVNYERHLANTERLARVEGQLSALNRAHSNGPTKSP